MAIEIVGLPIKDGDFPVRNSCQFTRKKIMEKIIPLGFVEATNPSLHVGKTMPCLPPMSGNGKHTTYKHGDGWGIIPWSNENPMGFVDSPAGESMLLVGGWATPLKNDGLRQLG